MKSKTPSVWVTLLFTGDDCDVVVTATYAEGIEAILGYLRERCTDQGHETTGLEVWEGNEKSYGCACALIDAGDVETLLHEWCHDAYGEAQGRFEGPDEHPIPTEAISAFNP